MAYCPDCKAPWGKFVIRDSELYKWNWLDSCRAHHAFKVRRQRPEGRAFTFALTPRAPERTIKEEFTKQSLLSAAFQSAHPCGTDLLKCKYRVCKAELGVKALTSSLSAAQGGAEEWFHSSAQTLEELDPTGGCLGGEGHYRWIVEENKKFMYSATNLNYTEAEKFSTPSSLYLPHCSVCSVMHVPLGLQRDTLMSGRSGKSVLQVARFRSSLLNTERYISYVSYDFAALLGY